LMFFAFLWIFKVFMAGDGVFLIEENRLV